MRGAEIIAALPLHRRIVPPVYFLLALLGMLALHSQVPVLRAHAPFLQAIGVLLIVAGVALAAWGAIEFRRAGTPVRPFLEASALVTTGPFRWTRNPMYLGMLAVLAGTWLALGSLTPVLIIPCFFLLIRHWFVRHEEAAMAGHFGGRYAQYCAGVRRWL
jgi:protein-S-isoprenylcysteine O-methyltransferase Ste14